MRDQTHRTGPQFHRKSPTAPPQAPVVPADLAPLRTGRGNRPMTVNVFPTEHRATEHRRLPASDNRPKDHIAHGHHPHRAGLR